MLTCIHSYLLRSPRLISNSRRILMLLRDDNNKTRYLVWTLLRHSCISYLSHLGMYPTNSASRLYPFIPSRSFVGSTDRYFYFGFEQASRRHTRKGEYLNTVSIPYSYSIPYTYLTSSTIRLLTSPNNRKLQKYQRRIDCWERLKSTLIYGTLVFVRR